MRWIKGEDHPKEPGQYHCNIESENFKGKSIHKDTCWFSSGGLWLTEYLHHRVVSWLDESPVHPTETPAPGEVHADQDKQPFEKYPVLCEYIQQLASFGHVDNWTNFLVQINTLCAQLTEATTSRNVLQNQAANATKDMGKLLEDLFKISEERDAYYQLFKELGDIGRASWGNWFFG